MFALFFRFATGLCFTIVYGALLTKTNRIARIFKAAKQTAKRPSFISPKSQLFICSTLIFVQVINSHNFFYLTFTNCSYLFSFFTDFNKWCLDGYFTSTCHLPLSNKRTEFVGLWFIHGCFLYDYILLSNFFDCNLHHLCSADT